MFALNLQANNYVSAAAGTTAAASTPSASGNATPMQLPMAHALEVTVPEQVAGNRSAPESLGSFSMEYVAAPPQ